MSSVAWAGTVHDRSRLRPGPSRTDLSVILPALGEGEIVTVLGPRLRRAVGELIQAYELIATAKDGDREADEAGSNAAVRGPGLMAVKPSDDSQCVAGVKGPAEHIGKGHSASECPNAGQTT